MTALRVTAASAVAILLMCLMVSVSAGEEEKPSFTLQEFKSGKNLSFSDILTSKANVMLVTETNCFSCIKELQALDWIRAKYRGDVSVSAVFIDRAGYSRVQRYAEYYKFDIDNLLIDDGQIVPARFKVTYIPTMFIFDDKGTQTYRKEGFNDGDETSIIKRIDDTIVPPKATPIPRAEAVPPSQGPKTVSGAPVRVPAALSPSPSPTSMSIPKGCTSPRV